MKRTISSRNLNASNIENNISRQTFAYNNTIDFYRGLSFRYEEWNPNSHYFNDEYTVDFVYHDNYIFYF